MNEMRKGGPRDLRGGAGRLGRWLTREGCQIQESASAAEARLDSRMRLTDASVRPHRAEAGAMAAS